MDTNHAAKQAFAQYAIRNGQPPLDAEGILDHQAVVVTLANLNNEGRSRCVEAIKYVYFYEPRDIDRKGEINRRVVRFSTKCHVSIPTAYRWLSEACSLYTSTREALGNCAK